MCRLARRELSVPRILLIEDDPACADITSAMLEDTGFEVQVAADGIEGIERFFNRRPDLVITDMIMLGCDGIETISAIRAVDPSVPVVVISGGSGNLLELARGIGAAAVVAKPFTEEALLSAIAQATGRPSEDAPAVAAGAL
jgi:CheY-like chemotaxis protein